MVIADGATMTVDGVQFIYSAADQVWKAPALPDGPAVTYVTELQTPSIRPAPYPADPNITTPTAVSP